MFRIVLAIFGVTLLFVVPSASPAASSTVVVSEVFAGGGNAGAPYANDYVELFNRSSATVDVNGWTVQYASAASTSWSATPLSGTIPAGGHYLVGLASGGAVGAALPAPDAIGTTNLAASGGKVALVGQAAALTCGATGGSCASVTALHDLVGYGAATDFEGASAAPALSATTAVVRAGGGCTDTNDNAQDFDALAPTPQNFTAAIAGCGSSSTGASSVVGVALDLQSSLALTLDRSSVSFGTVVPGTTPAPVAVTATVFSNGSAGYALTVHRTAFTPADLPVAISVNGNPFAAVPLATATDLALATTTAPSASGGDTWPTRLGFAAPLPVLTPAHYAATVTYTVIAR